MVCALYGCRAWLLTCCHTGDMTKKVRNRERPMTIWLEGACCVPMAVLRKERTTTMRVKDVVMMMIPGASDKMVMRNNICSTTAMSPGFATFPIPTLMVGRASGSAAARLAANRDMAQAVSKMEVVFCVLHAENNFVNARILLIRTRKTVLFRTVVIVRSSVRTSSGGEVATWS